MTGFTYQMPVILHKSDSLTPPAFKLDIECYKRNLRLFRNIKYLALCAAACVNVAQCVQNPCLWHAFFCIEYSGYGARNCPSYTKNTR